MTAPRRVTLRDDLLRRATILTGALAAILAIGLLSMPLATADALPYTDPGSVGRLTLCDVTGRSVTSGNIHVKPFVWRAVGSAPGDGVYRTSPGRTATLFAYQPIKDVDPTLWNGEFLTGSARYTNPSEPMAASTAVDPTLADFLRDYPPKWDGLVELRLFLGAPLNPTVTQTYSASSIRVSGDTWQLVDGGSASCSSGTASSSELRLPAVAKLGTPRANATTAGPTKPGAKSSAADAAGLPANGAATGSSAVGGEGSVASSAHSSEGGLSWLWVVAGALLLGGGGVAWWRFRPRVGPGPFIPR
jgi:hypothetical protein